MGIVDQAIEDGIGNCRFADLLVPVIHMQLTGNDGGGVTVPFLTDFQKVSSFRIGHGADSIINFSIDLPHLPLPVQDGAH